MIYLLFSLVFSSLFFSPASASKSYDTSQKIAGSWKFIRCIRDDEEAPLDKNSEKRPKNTELFFTFGPEGSFTSFAKIDTFKKDREEVIEFYQSNCKDREGVWGVWDEKKLKKVCEDPKKYYENVGVFRIRRSKNEGSYTVNGDKIELRALNQENSSKKHEKKKSNVGKIKNLDFYYFFKQKDSLLLYNITFMENGELNGNPEDHYCDLGYVFAKQQIDSIY